MQKMEDFEHLSTSQDSSFEDHHHQEPHFYPEVKVVNQCQEKKKNVVVEGEEGKTAEVNKHQRFQLFLKWRREILLLSNMSVGNLC